MKKLIGLLSVLFIAGGCAFADDLANVSLNYCTASDNVLQYQIDPGAETWICYTLSNASKKPVTIKLSFVDGTYTNDQRQNKACLSDADIENFGKYVTDYEQIVTLKAGETIKKEAKLRYPEGMDGLYHGCVVYSVVESQEAEASTAATSFSILMRRAKFIDVIVGNPENAKERGIILEEFTDADGENISRNRKIRIYKDNSDNTYVMQIKVKNVSPVEQDVVITWVASNILMYKNTFLETRKILKGESLLISKKIDRVPAYNLSIKLNISNTPFSFGNAQEPVIGHLKEKTTILIWDVRMFITIIGLLLLIGILYLLIKDLKKKSAVKVKIVHDKAPVEKTSTKKPIKKKK